MDKETVERVARAIAKELARQDGYGDDFILNDGKLRYLDQGEVDMFEVARAAIEAMNLDTIPIVDIADIDRVE